MLVFVQVSWQLVWTCPKPHAYCNVQVNVSKVWLTLSSIIVALSFAFSNTIMNLFNSVIMLFVVHP